MTILRAWLAAAVAWLVAQVLPIVLKLLDDHRLENQRSTLVSRRAALVAEWGLENEQR